MGLGRKITPKKGGASARRGPGRPGSRSIEEGPVGPGRESTKQAHAFTIAIGQLKLSLFFEMARVSKLFRLLYKGSMPKSRQSALGLAASALPASNPSAAKS